MWVSALHMENGREGKPREGTEDPVGSQSWNLESSASVAFHCEDCLILDTCPPLPTPPPPTPAYNPTPSTFTHCFQPGAFRRRDTSPVIPASLSESLPEYFTRSLLHLHAPLPPALPPN